MVICKHYLVGCMPHTCMNAKPRKKLLYGREYCSAFTKTPEPRKIEKEK